MDHLQELPGLYEIQGIEMEIRVPKTSEKTVARVPLSHIAYNIVLPRVGKRIDPVNYRRKISDYIRGIEGTTDPEVVRLASYRKNSKCIMLNYDRPLFNIPAFICGELGHAFSDFEYDIPDEWAAIKEYYDFLAQKEGEKEFKNSRYSFTLFDIRNETESYKAVRDFRKLENLICGLETNELSSRKQMHDAERHIKIACRLMDKIREYPKLLSIGHFLGYASAEIVHEAIGVRGFQDFRKIFDVFENDGLYSVAPREDFVSCLPQEYMKRMDELCRLSMYYDEVENRRNKHLGIRKRKLASQRKRLHMREKYGVC